MRKIVRYYILYMYDGKTAGFNSNALLGLIYVCDYPQQDLKRGNITSDPPSTKLWLRGYFILTIGKTSLNMLELSLLYFSTR